MRRNIGAVAQTMLKTEIRTSEGYSENVGDQISATNAQKRVKQNRYEGKKQFNLIIPENIYQAVKERSVDEERSMNSFIVFAVKQALKNQE